ncbi:MAG: DUF6797 domain-containing protein [Planctomycetota bacterium]
MLLLVFGSLVSAQTLESELLQEDPTNLARDAKLSGDASRGAVLFHRPELACASCHEVATNPSTDSIGPNLAKLGGMPDTSDADLVRSVLRPSASIRKGYESTRVLTTDGQVLVGRRVGSERRGMIVLIDASTRKPIAIAESDVEIVETSSQSTMPAGVINGLRTRQDFVDLIRYLQVIRDGGLSAAAELTPPSHLLTLQLPDYESKVDHAGMIQALNKDALNRGRRIYQRVCQNCHGTIDAPGSLPTATRFANGKLRNGSSPFAMYQTITRGFGAMLPQPWMVPQQKYDVIHYIRQTFLKGNPNQSLAPISAAFLASLPKGDTFGPEPVELSPWSDMDYGPWMHNTIEAAGDQNGANIAYKGIALRLDPGPGGVAKGNHWMLFDHDTMRVAAAWSHTDRERLRFIDWKGIHFDGRHQSHPKAIGAQAFTNPTGPGWANPETGSFVDSARVQGRDGRRYGPLPKTWATYHGMHHAGDSQVFSYRVGETDVLEQLHGLGLSTSTSPSSSQTFLRTLHIGRSDQSQTLLIATGDEASTLQRIGNAAVTFGNVHEQSVAPEEAGQTLLTSGAFDGHGWLEFDDDGLLDVSSQDYTIVARVRTRSDGVVFAKTARSDTWVKDGVMLFVDNGRLCLDVGWAGVVRSRKRIDDGKWHDVAVTWRRDGGKVRVFVDGTKVGGGSVAPKGPLEKAVVRLGFGAKDFPNKSAFVGQLSKLAFVQRELEPHQFAAAPSSANLTWRPSQAPRTDNRGKTPTLPRYVVNTDADSASQQPPIVVGMTGQVEGCRLRQQGRRLCLTIPASEMDRQLTVWYLPEPAFGANVDRASVGQVTKQVDDYQSKRLPLIQLIQQPARPLWPEVLSTIPLAGRFNDSGFAADVLTPPMSNPWLARIRFGGFDFFDDDPNRMIVCTWDGDVYEVSGLSDLGMPQAKLSWRRIASGLFQPLGVKIVDGVIHLTCRDQLLVLRDHNQDGVIDFYQCFNNDHQVTEHFHEFAMGLQRGDDGSFYYAKSARHALTAVVPHHGTLLKVSPDGSETSIIANGFRAANGVCLNPDGSFIVTDQEGHWNPKNRINWVRPGGFYGNMYGYHNVTDSSDDAMQPPLCWITNKFDRSPAELIWVPENRWGRLSGTLLNLSYGYGKLYTVPHQRLASRSQSASRLSPTVQGGMCAFPLEQFPTGLVRGRFHPTDDGLYLCGLFAWGSSQQTQEGGLYRVRYQGQGAVMPISNSAQGQTLSVTFSDPLSSSVVDDLKRFSLKTWSLRRTKNYGSDHYDETDLEIVGATLTPDRRTLTLTIPRLQPTWCYELAMELEDQDQRSVRRVIHGTIHSTETP